MARKMKNLPLKDRFFKRLGLFGGFFTLLSSVFLIAFLIMNMLGLNYFIDEEEHYYWIQFQTEERVLLDMRYKRGAKFDKPADPKHSKDEYYSFTFRGWDYTGDNVPDAIPTHAYFTFRAVAVYQKTQIKPLPKSSKPSSSSPKTSSETSSMLLNNTGASYGA